MKNGKENPSSDFQNQGIISRRNIFNLYSRIPRDKILKEERWRRDETATKHRNVLTIPG